MFLCGCIADIGWVLPCDQDGLCVSGFCGVAKNGVIHGAWGGRGVLMLCFDLTWYSIAAVYHCGSHLAVIASACVVVVSCCFKP